jgi:Fe-S cluster assembly protein SufB
VSTSASSIEALASQEYKWGFVTEIGTDSVPKGLNEDIIRLISTKKKEPDFMLDWRLKSYRQWLTTEEPTWANVHYSPIDYRDAVQQGTCCASQVFERQRVPAAPTFTTS